MQIIRSLLFVVPIAFSIVLQLNPRWVSAQSAARKPALLSAQAQNTKPLEAFKPFLGNWVAPDTAAIYKTDSSAKGTVFFSFQEMADYGALEVLEHFKPGDKSTATFVGMVCYNPVTGRFNFFGTNPKANLMFEGYFEQVGPLEFTRRYDVYYPKDAPVAQSAGQVISYKERFVLKNSDVLEFDTQFFSKKEQVWKSWGGAKYILVRK